MGTPPLRGSAVVLTGTLRGFTVALRGTRGGRTGKTRGPYGEPPKDSPHRYYILTGTLRGFTVAVRGTHGGIDVGVLKRRPPPSSYPQFGDPLEGVLKPNRDWFHSLTEETRYWLWSGPMIPQSGRDKVPNRAKASRYFGKRIGSKGLTNSGGSQN